MTLEQIKADESQYLMHTYGRFNVALVKARVQGLGTKAARNILISQAEKA